MRIAVSGAHIVGKSTLAAELARRMPRHVVVAEPYDILAGRGYEFSHPPTSDDYIIQLKQSLISLRRRSPNLIFDRCPLDFLGYIAASPGSARFDVEAWREPIARAMARLDLVVFLPADPAWNPDIPSDDAALRLAVDDALRDIIDGDSYDLCEDVAILTLDGARDRQIETVLTHIERASAPRS